MEREDAVEEMLLGLVSQLAEADDLKVVEDLQSEDKSFFFKKAFLDRLSIV